MPYLYAVVGAGARSPSFAGAFGEPLALVSSGNVQAVVGARAEVPAVTRESLAGHDRVVRALGAEGAALPARFGQVLDDDALAEALRARGETLAEALALVDGCVQMTLRVALESGPNEGEGRARPTSGRAYLEERRALRSPPELAAFQRALSPLARAEKTQVTRAPRVLASLYQLVPKAHVDEWRLTFARARDDSATRAQATGPWPPYAFVPEVA